ncbi:MAG: hypothetical protein ACLFR2_01770 [Candidatus Kapaibacterium sp.]
MSYTFDKQDIEKISKTLGIKEAEFENAWTWKMNDTQKNESLVFSIYNSVGLGKDLEGSLVTVQTNHGYYEIHDVTAYLVFEPDEVIFIHSTNEYLSCLIIGRQITCSSYSNIRREILSSDFSKLDPAVLLSAMQLSLTEGMLP